MATINRPQEQQVTFISGVTAGGSVAAESFWSWNYDSSPSYGPDSSQSKWSNTTAGAPAQISYAFEPSSNWSVTEQAAFTAVMDLWSAVANLSFQADANGDADLVIRRNSAGTASGGVELYFPGSVGSTRLGLAASGSISIDAGATAFGPLGGALNTNGGYPWLTILHELGHVIGLGHAGPYDGTESHSVVYTAYDGLPWTIMSYNDEGTTGGGMTYGWGRTRQGNLLYENVPTTWMPLDIIAIQRLYGAPAVTPLSGGQIYGFNSNISGPIAKFFDFTQNSQPIVTLWNRGTGNTLDLSGFATSANINLHDGSFSSVGGLTNNLAIAYGTRIDNFIGGPGADTILANDNSNAVLGGGGADLITGGNGNDHLFGAARVAMPGDGADTIRGGAGNDYIQGNAGDDRLEGDAGSDRLQGGQANDWIVGGDGHDSVNGNLGADVISGGDGNDSLRGGQGNDSIDGNSGHDLLLGDRGADRLNGGAGIDLLAGGEDADIFVFDNGDASFAIEGELAYLTDAILDFADGLDRIATGIGTPSQLIQGGSQDNLALAGLWAQQLLAGHPASSIAIFAIGSDTYLFYDAGQAFPLEAVKLAGFTDPALITAADFT